MLVVLENSAKVLERMLQANSLMASARAAFIGAVNVSLP
jgi:hypothetical protein